MQIRSFLIILALVLTSAFTATAQSGVPSEQALPRTADGKPNLDGIWQASSTAYADLEDHAARLNMLAGSSVLVGGGSIPYQPWAAAQKAKNFQNREAADPLNKCYMAGVPRMMYLEYPFQIFQTSKAVAIAFEWSLDWRLIYTDGSPHQEDLTFWMGDSRGRWEGDTLVVDVRNNNEKTWLDMAGDFHSDALHVVERYRMMDANTIQYEATLDDSKVFTMPWTIRLELHRRTDRNRLFEYVCQDEVEEANGAFTPEARTWYPGNGAPAAVTPAPASVPAPPAKVAVDSRAAGNIRRTADGKPDLQGAYTSDDGSANQGLERRTADALTPAGRGVIVDPPSGKLPVQEWAAKEKIDRNRPERGYDDPTAHCFPAGVPRSIYIPAAFHIIQTKDYLVFLHERMAWRIVALDGRAHLPDSIRLWQGDSVGHWEGDTLVVDTTNLNGKTWLNEAGEVVSYAEHVVERFTPTGPDTIRYEAAVNDPVVYTRPWTMAFPLRRSQSELLEAACHEEDHDLPHLKALKDAAERKK